MQIQIYFIFCNTIYSVSLQTPVWTVYQKYIFWIIDHPMVNWKDAEAHCVVLGGHLVSFNNIAQENFLLFWLSSVWNMTQDELTIKPLWVGCHKKASGTWQWMDGTICNGHWNQSALHISSGDCAAWNGNTNFTLSVNCNELKGFLCQSDNAFVPRAPIVAGVNTVAIWVVLCLALFLCLLHIAYTVWRCRRNSLAYRLLSVPADDDPMLLL